MASQFSKSVLPKENGKAVGLNREEFETHYDQEALHIGFNVQYLPEFLCGVGGMTSIRMQDSSRRALRYDGFHYDVRVHNRSNRCSPFSTPHQAEREQRTASCLSLVDMVTTVPKTEIGTHVGRLADEDMVRLNRAVLVFLGIAAPTGNEQLESP